MFLFDDIRLEFLMCIQIQKLLTKHVNAACIMFFNITSELLCGDRETRRYVEFRVTLTSDLSIKHTHIIIHPVLCPLQFLSIRIRI